MIHHISCLDAPGYKVTGNQFHTPNFLLSGFKDLISSTP